MSTISSAGASATTKSAASSKGLSGLASGIDTEQMVEDMLAGAQLKIDKANQQKQVLTWKQAMYRDVITALQNFQNKYFSYTSPSSNLLSSGFYKTMSTSASSGAVTAIASTSAAAGTMTVNSVTQLATQYKVTSGAPAMKELSGTFSLENLHGLLTSRTVDVSLNGISATVTVEGSTEAEILDSLNAQFTAAFGEDALVATSTNGTLTLTGANVSDLIKIGDDSNPTALSILGLTSGTTVTGMISSQFDLRKTEETLSITLDGITKNITLNTAAASAGEFTASLRTEISKAFGNGISVTESDGVVSFTPMKVIYTDDGSGNLVAAGTAPDASRQITLSGSNGVMSVLGLTDGISNKVSLGAKLGDIPFASALTGTDYSFEINGITFNAAADETLSSVISRINESEAGVTISYSSLEGTFSITSKSYGAGTEITMSDTEGGFLNALLGSEASRITETGKNAVLRVNGVDIQRSANTFTFDGVTMTLNETTNTATTITVTRNSQTIEDGITGFVNDYNSLIEKINELIQEDPTYKKYPALTAAQKKEMSETEIKLWEEKAKEGLLRGDSTLTSLLTNIRAALLTKVADSSFTLFSLGIEPSSNYADNGKLVISDNAKLKKAIENDPESIRKLFADPDNGIAVKINTLLNKAVKVSYSTPGSLIALAGSNDSDKKSTINKQISDIEDRLKTLQKQYETQKVRYWDSFTAMERLISQMNQQSAWLASQFAI